MAPTQYTIYLVNNSASTQVFWCFLAPPQELAGDPAVYANSSTTLAVAPQSQGINTFTIPVQYVVGAGASNNAVGLSVKIDSSITKKSDLGQMWDAGYATVPPNMGPTLILDSAPVGKTQIAIKSNAFNQQSNEANGWFSNMSYGIQTAQGFIGMSWSPSPQQTRTLTPLLQFYVSVGSYGINSLASWTDVSNTSAVLSVPESFRFNKTTVTYTELGGWEVTPGEPTLLASAGSTAGAMSSLIQSHKLLSEAHAELIGMTRGDLRGLAAATSSLASLGESQPDTLISVRWDKEQLAAAAGETYLTGTVSVQTALIASFTAFVLSGIKFEITRDPKGDTNVKFSYSGSRSVEFIKSLFVEGAKLLFS